MTLSGADIAQLLSAHGLKPSRALGQNFVTDPNTVRRIARLSGRRPGSHVLEIGAGLGSLTLALAETGARVVAVETDRHLVPVLRSVVDGPGWRRSRGMPSSWTWRPSWPSGAPDRGAWWPTCPTTWPRPWWSGPWWRCRRSPVSWSWCSGRWGSVWPPPRARTPYGAVSVRIAYFARAEVVGRVPASVFLPRPRVESVLVRLERRPEPAVDPALVSYERLNAVVRAGFAQRRKMLRRSLAGVVDPAAFERAGVRPDARAEELDVAAWGRLAAL